MKIPAILFVNFGAGALPLLAGIGRRNHLTAPRKWILGWSALLVAGNLIALGLALENRNNHWLNYWVTPVVGSIALWALSYWQTSLAATRWIRFAIPLFLCAWLVIVVAVEDLATFSLLAEPFAGLLVLGAALFTLVRGALRELGKLARQDWFWVTLGLSLVSLGSVALPPAAKWLLASNPGLVIKAYEVKAVLEILGLMAITLGICCPPSPGTTRSLAPAQ